MLATAFLNHRTAESLGRGALAAAPAARHLPSFSCLRRGLSPVISEQSLGWHRAASARTHASSSPSRTHLLELRFKGEDPEEAGG